MQCMFVFVNQMIFLSGFDWCEAVTVYSGTVRECKLLRVRFINVSNVSPASGAVIGS